MKPKTMILMVIAIVCGLGASYMTSRLLAERNTEKVEAPKVKILLAKKDLSVGVHIKKPEDLFELKEYAKDSLPHKDAITSYDKVKGKYLKLNLKKGYHLTPKDIEDNPTILEIPQGMVAVGIRVNAESIAGGFAASPGSKVNIMWTIKNAQIGAQCVTLLEEVLVVAADTQSNPHDDKKAIVANVVTVALTPKDAQKVNLAKEVGTLSLALRNAGEDGKSHLGSLNLKQLLNDAKKSGLNLDVATDAEGNPIIIHGLENPVVQPKDVPKDTPKTTVDIKPTSPDEHEVIIKEGTKIRKQIFQKDAKGNWYLKGTTYHDVAPSGEPPAVSNDPSGSSSGPAVAPPDANPSGPKKSK